MRKNNAIDLDSREIPHSLSLALCCPARTFWSGQEGAVKKPILLRSHVLGKNHAT
jgi:hypothetical protein